MVEQGYIWVPRDGAGEPRQAREESILSRVDAQRKCVCVEDPVERICAVVLKSMLRNKPRKYISLPDSENQKYKFPVQVKYTFLCRCRFQRTCGVAHCDKLQS
jgi:hypothetical protein